MTAEELLEANGYEDVVIFKDYSYDDAHISWGKPPIVMFPLER